jgi:hypothetical protein
LVKPSDYILLSSAVVSVFSNKDLYDKLKEVSKGRVLDFDIKNIIKEWDFLFLN